MNAAPTFPPAAHDFVERARAEERAGRLDEALECYEAALYRLRGAPNAAAASALMRWVGRLHELKGDLDAAADTYEAAQAVAVASTSLPDVAHVLNCRGILEFRRGRLDVAAELYEEARRLASEADEPRLMAMVDQNLGNVASVHGDHADALRSYERSRNAYERLGLIDYVGPLLTNIGRVHIELAQWADAARAFDSAEVICAHANNPMYQVLVRVNRTRLHLRRGAFVRARSACDDAFELSLELGEERWLGEIHMHAGVIHRESGRPALAEHEFQRARAEAEGRNELLLGAEIRVEHAHLFRRQERNRELLECLFEAHEAFAQLRAQHDLADVGREIERLERRFESIVQSWGESIESADRYTRGHCERVADLACRLADAVGLDRRALTWFRMGALLHDVGKVDVPAEILNKAGPLDDEEWSIVRRHPERGVELLAAVDFPWDIRPMVLHHHERWDGSGYPHGLAGGAIPLAARILCVADVYDALTTTRSYRRGFSPRVALEIMEEEAGRVLDPELFQLFQSVLLPDIGSQEAVSRGLLQLGLPGRTIGFDERRPPRSAVA
ncbi:MAG: HD domain-containing phosphohydrolase [Gemmatimonadota bacterium]